MNIAVNQKALSESFLDCNGKLTHHSGKLIKLFPFVTNKSKKDAVLKELANFRGVTGKALRLYFEKELPEDFTKQSILTSAMSIVTASQPNILKKVLADICFDSDGNICKFNRKALLYQKTQSAHTTLNNFSEYIYEIFLKNLDITFNNIDSKIILNQLLEKAIPELDDKQTIAKVNYYYGLNSIRNVFKKDISILMQDDKFFIDNLDDFLKYYLYFYLTQMFFRLKNYENDKQSLRSCFYSVDWESLSESRDAYKYGMKLFHGQSAELFPHVICLELLHYIDGLEIDKFTYLELQELVDTLSGNDRQVLADAIGEIYDFYINSVTDISWDDFETKYISPNSPNVVFSSIDKLLKAIKYQFNKSSRHSARDGYGKWLLEYGQCNFGKKRGRLGYTHVLSQNFILLFVKICIGGAKDDRLRLSDLWEELKLRGISFDQYSKVEVTNFLDKNNMLEKKSDSGDAQYVTVQE